MLKKPSLSARRAVHPSAFEYGLVLLIAVVVGLAALTAAGYDWRSSL